MNTSKRFAIFSTFASLNPNPKTELVYTSPFELLIAVILSAQATDISVNRATTTLYKVANTPETLLALGEDGLIPYIQTIGLFRNKARHIIATCAQLLQLHNGNVPHDRTSLERLPGVGRKTANVILNTVFGEATIAVDTHIFRVCNRTKLASAKTVELVEAKLMRSTPSEFKQHAHHWLVLHGRYVCKARTPLCKICPIIPYCEYPNKVF